MGLGKEDRPFPAGCCPAVCLRAGLGLLGGAEGASVKRKKKKKKVKLMSPSSISFLLSAFFKFSLFFQENVF